MAKLEAATHNKMPASAFGLPGQRKYPMEDRVHQIKAEEFATKDERKGQAEPGAGIADQSKGQAAVSQLSSRRFSVEPFHLFRYLEEQSFRF